MTIEVDVSELRDLATGLDRIPDAVHKGIHPVVSKGALNIKTEMQMDLASSTHFAGITFSVNYETVVNSTGVEARIGPDKGKYGGALANIAYFGTSRGGGTVPDPAVALISEGDRFEQAMLALVESAL